MSSLAKSDLGQRLIRGMEQTLTDGTKLTKKQRTELEARLAEWKAAAAK